MKNLFQQALICIKICDPYQKTLETNNLVESWQGNLLDTNSTQAVETMGVPGRPDKPILVKPNKLSKRNVQTEEGKAALMHAIAHIEFNAINLALDAVYRFRDLPDQYYSDWLRVAKEEAHHFELINQYLGSIGYRYGDFEAHNGLWEMAQRTSADVMVRMALVPRVLEARGLDAGPGIIKRLTMVGDQAAVDILGIIMQEEIGHVEIGTRWFRYFCQQRDLEPQATFEKLFRQYMKGRLKLPLHREARLQAGFNEKELAFLEGFSE